MGKNRRVFSEPKYEINLESKDRVLIRQERKGPLGQVLKRIGLVTGLVLVSIWLAGLLFNLVSFSFYPTNIILNFSHNAEHASLSLQELQNINIYLNGRTKPLQTRTLPDGITFKFKKRGQHIIGIENRSSRYDSLTFAKERALLDSLGLFKQKRHARKYFDNFVFHKILSDHDIAASRFLSFLTRPPHTRLPHVYLSYANQSSVVIAAATTGSNLDKTSPLVHDFQGALFKNLLKFSPHVGSFDDENTSARAGMQTLDLPTFNELSWYSENIRTHRYQYADNINARLTSSIFVLPYLFKDSAGQAFANVVLAFADIGDVTFDPIEIRTIRLTSADSPAFDAPIFSIVQAYLSLYDSFLFSGSLDASMINAFIQICNNTPNADPVARIGNRIMRTTVIPQKTSIVYTLDDFFAKIENMDCMALFNELAHFWTNDPYELQSIPDFNIQEKEVVRAIIKWSLALKENEHDCAEDDWPNNAQRLSFFSTIKNVIDQTASLAWLQNDALYGVLIIEINKLPND